MSGGRLILGAGIGWSEREFDTLGQAFWTRGRRMDEILDLKPSRAWNDDPVTFTGDHYTLSDIRVLPKPAHRISIWIGGAVEASFRRAVERGDGFQVVGRKPPEVVDIVRRLRQDRPEPSFVISARTGWDTQGMDPGLIREEWAAFEATGDPAHGRRSLA